jgi:flavin reductase (DIM6/NTAB) family NADH-FMN oxidoreductase RutF
MGSFDSGSPFLRDAVISLECRLIRQVQESTHCLMVGEVISGRYNDDALPLLYRDGQWLTTSDDLLMAPAER